MVHPMWARRLGRRPACRGGARNARRDWAPCRVGRGVWRRIATSGVQSARPSASGSLGNAEPECFGQVMTPARPATSPLETFLSLPFRPMNSCWPNFVTTKICPQSPAEPPSLRVRPPEREGWPRLPDRSGPQALSDARTIVTIGAGARTSESDFAQVAARNPPQSCRPFADRHDRSDVRAVTNNCPGRTRDSCSWR